MFSAAWPGNSFRPQRPGLAGSHGDGGEVSQRSTIGTRGEAAGQAKMGTNLVQIWKSPGVRWKILPGEGPGVPAECEGRGDEMCEHLPKYWKPVLRT